MFREIIKQISSTFVFLLFSTLIFGFLYPGAVTLILQHFFPENAHGSLLFQGEKIIGSRLLGQPFSNPGTFWSRPSATNEFPYNALSSGGSNLSPANPLLLHHIKERIKALQIADPNNKQKIPFDLVTASGSGLDPHISIAAAQYQVSRIARVKNISETTLNELIQQSAKSDQFGLLSEPYVNVIELNLALFSLLQSAK